MQLFGGYFSNAVKTFHLQMVDKFLGLLGGNDKKAVGFFYIGSRFCQKLVVRNSGRCGQPGFGNYPFFNFFGD